MRYDPMMPFRYKRRSIRLKGHNYGWSASYFVTICVKPREPFFTIPKLRAILEATWKHLPQRFEGLTLDEFVIMPDHIHFILHLEGNVAQPTTLGKVVGAYKSLALHHWWAAIESKDPDAPGLFWHRGYHEHLIRDQQELEQKRQYIRDNPRRLEQRLRMEAEKNHKGPPQSKEQ